MNMNLKPNKHKIISFNTTTMTSLGFIIVGPPPLLKGEGRTFRKLSHLGGGGTKFLLEMEDKLVRGGGVNVEMVEGGCHFLITLQFNIYCM